MISRSQYAFVSIPASIVVNGQIFPLRDDRDVRRGEDVAFLIESASRREAMRGFSVAPYGTLSTDLSAAQLTATANRVHNVISSPYSGRGLNVPVENASAISLPYDCTKNDARDALLLPLLQTSVPAELYAEIQPGLPVKRDHVGDLFALLRPARWGCSSDSLGVSAAGDGITSGNVAYRYNAWPAGDPSPSDDVAEMASTVSLSPALDFAPFRAYGGELACFVKFVASYSKHDYTASTHTEWSNHVAWRGFSVSHLVSDTSSAISSGIVSAASSAMSSLGLSLTDSVGEPGPEQEVANSLRWDLSATVYLFFRIGTDADWTD